jgi:ATP-dependent Clp protease adapter protein ClpS
MTHDRRFKKRVRARIAETGESYTVAYQHLRHLSSEETSMSENKFQKITNHDFGYSLQIPSGWRDVGPFIYNSAFEVARYLKKDDDLHEGIVNIFWGFPGKSTRWLAETGDASVFDLSQAGLEKEGIKKTSISETHIGNRPATRLNWESNTGDWSTRCYFMAVRDTFICLNMGSREPTRDCQLFDEIANSFDAIEDTAGIVFVRDDKTPASFVTNLLEEVFDYRHDQATQRLVRINAQRESVVALVPKVEASQIVSALNERSKAAGYSLTCRTAN